MNRFVSLCWIAQVTALLGAFAFATPRAAAGETPFRIEGTFTFELIGGNRVEATGAGRAAPGGNFTFHDIVRAEYGGREIEGYLTFEFTNGSTLTIYYEAPISDDGVVEGPYVVVDGTGKFKGETGGGTIWYPIGQGAPFTLDGVLRR